MDKNRLLFLFLILTLVLEVNAQTKHRYVVHFKNKSGVEYSLDHPEMYLSGRAIDRRDKLSIEIDSADLPVSSAYIQQLKNLDVETYFSSKWANAVLVQMESSKLVDIQNLPFVEKVVYAAKNSQLQTVQSNPVIGPFVPLDTVKATSDIQNYLIGTNKMIRDGYTGEGMMIAVLDAGFPYVNQYDLYQHLFDNNQIVSTKDFIKNSGNVYQYHIHGAAVLSILAGLVTDKYHGPASDASYVLCVTEDVNSEYRIEEYNWLFAAEYADSLGVDIISTSLGYFDFDDNSMNYTYENMDGKTTVAAFAAEKAVSKGMVVVASAGNEGNNYWHYITTPSDGANVLSIGAVDQNLISAKFSSFGPSADGRVKPDVCALGSAVSVFNYGSTTKQASISQGNGTSYAAPQIAGMAAGLWQSHPEWTNYELIDHIRKSAHLYDSPNDSLGYGVANYVKAYYGNVITGDLLEESQVVVYPNPVMNELKIQISDTGNQYYQILFINTEGKVLLKKEIQSADSDQPVLNLESISPGTYFLRLSSNSLNRTLKVIKQ